MKKINILISGAGGSGTIALIKNLRQNSNYTVVSIDSDEYAVGLYLSDYSYKVPPVNSPNFREAISKIIKTHNIELYIPLIDEEITIAHELSNEISNLKVLAPRKEFCENVLNKWNMYKLFKQHNIPTPKTELLDTEIKFSSYSQKIIKPIVGRGSRGVQSIDTQEELEAYLVLSKYQRKDLLIQERIEGVEYTVSVVVDKEGKVLTVVPKRIIKKKGITQIAITESNTIINSICNEIQDKLKANGPFNVQLILNKNQPYVFEINPRFSTSLVLTIEAGINEVDVLIKDAFDLTCSVEAFKEGIIMSRYYEQMFFKENEVK